MRVRIERCGMRRDVKSRGSIMRRFVVGLTEGIVSGKSLAFEAFAWAGVSEPFGIFVVASVLSLSCLLGPNVWAATELAVSSSTLAASTSAEPERAPALWWSTERILEDMEQVVLAEPGQDGAALLRLETRFNAHLIILGMRGSAGSLDNRVKAVADKSKDWRFRRFTAITLMDHSASKKVTGALLSVLLDRIDHPGVRAGAAMGLYEAAMDSATVRSALESVVRDTETAKDLFRDAVWCLGAVGADDLDLMLQVAGLAPVGNPLSPGRPPILTNAGAIRAIARSRNPKALEVLISLLERYPSNSYLRGIVVDHLHSIAKTDVERLNPWRDKLVGPLLAMTYSEKFGEGPLNETVQLLGLLRERRAVNRLIEIMNDPKIDPVMVCRAAVALGEIGDKKALPYLEKVWEKLPNDSRGGGQFRHLLELRKEGHPTMISDILDAIQKLRRLKE